MRRFRSVGIACVLALVIVGLLASGVGALTINKLEMVPCGEEAVTYTPYGINYPSGTEMVCVGFDIVRASNEVLYKRISDASGHVWWEGSFLPPCPASECHSWGQIGYCAYGCPANGRVWPNGFYHFDLLVNEELARSLPFSVGVSTVYLPLVLK